MSDESVGIERKNSGQCECGNDAFESIQIKMILNPTFEIVLKLLFKSSKLKPIDTDKSGVSSLESRRQHCAQSVLSGFISENNSSIVCCATCLTRSVLSIPAMLTPFTTALISSRKSVRNRNGSGELLATRAIRPVISIWQAIMRPFSSSITHLD
jgi:hypothetical protein